MGTGFLDLLKTICLQLLHPQLESSVISDSTITTSPFQIDLYQSTRLFGAAYGYSRAVHVVATPSMDAKHTYEAIVQAFEYFGGVSDEVLVDDQKAAVIDWRDARAQFNVRFRQLGAHMGIAPHTCRPRRA